ncbi:MAG: hypothetical protein JNG54_09930 [Faecalibacterium prausnitzii]|nr:hypothetical protein [Faecalibacterium prausnitzii]
MTERKTSPAPPAREPAQRKKRPALWPARSAKPLDQKKKHPPRRQRENQLKEKTNSASGPRGAQSHLTKRKNLPRATPFYVFTQNIAVCVFNAQATSANCISQICHFDRHYF